MGVLSTLAAPQEPVLGGAAAFWGLMLCAVLLAVCAAALWLLVARSTDVLEQARRVSALDKINSQLARLTGERSDIDLRRIEHVLLDVRDGLAKVEGALLDVLQGARQSPDAAAVDAPGGWQQERVVNRLLALGYERVELTGDAESPASGEGTSTSDEAAPDPDPSDAAGGSADSAAGGTREVLVEAYRRGALYKGRVRLRDGRIDSVEMNPAYSVFP